MDIKKSAVSSFSWSILIQLSHQIIGFAVSIILARILFPKDFGVIGMIAIFITLGRMLLDGGLASSLIRNKNVTQADYSTVFLTNVIVAFFIYIVLFATAPFIAVFFNEPILTKLLRIYGVVILVGSFSIVQSVRLNKNLQFNVQFKLLFPSLIISAGVSIWMAYNGYGVWSLVWKEILFTVISSVQLWYYAKWRPSLVFDRNLFKYHFNFGSKLLLNNILSKFFNDIYTVVIGKYFSAATLGLYTRAQSMVELPSGVIFNSINRVMYPLLSNVNDDDVRLKRIYRKIISTVMYLSVPVLAMMAILAKPLILFLLTEKWIEAVPYFQILIIAAFFSPIQSYMENICMVKGKSSLVLRLSFFKYLLLVTGLIPALWFGIFGLLWSLVVVSVISAMVSAYFAGRLISYSVKEQLMDIYQPYLICLLSAGILMSSNYIFHVAMSNNFLMVIVGCLLFTILFLLLSYLFKNTVFISGVSVVYNKLRSTYFRK